MSSTTKIVGMRIRSFRQAAKMTQEELAERADLHPTYIGQAERGEKNLTITSLEKILSALGISFAEFFERTELSDSPSIAALCYDLISGKTRTEQEKIFRILSEISQLING